MAIIDQVCEAVRIDQGENCQWTTAQMREALKTYFRTLKDNSKRRSDVEHNDVCRRAGRQREKISRRVWALEEIKDLDDSVKEKVLPVLSKEYTSSDESAEEEDDNGEATKVFLTKKLVWGSSKLKEIKQMLDDFYLKRMNRPQIKRGRHPVNSTRKIPKNACKWAVRSLVQTSTPNRR